MKKRFLSLFLSFVLLFSLFPATTAHAASIPVYYNQVRDLTDAGESRYAGCYITSIAMILTSMGIKNATPNDVYAANGKTVNTYWSKVHSYYGVTSDEITISGYSSAEIEEVLVELCKRHPEGVFVGGNTKKNYPHAVVVFLNENGEIRYHDPGINSDRIDGKSQVFNSTNTHLKSFESLEQLIFFRVFHKTNSSVKHDPILANVNYTCTSTNATITFDTLNPSKVKITELGFFLSTKSNAVKNGIRHTDNISSNLQNYKKLSSTHNLNKDWNTTLEPATKYYFVVYACDSNGKYYYSDEQSFTTTGSAKKVTSVSLSPQSKTLDIGETVQLSATITPSNAANKEVTWTSSNTAVATVSGSGKVTAKGEGTATIQATAKDGSGKYGSATIQVVCKHTNGYTIKAAVAATCTKTGLTEGKNCSVCNEVIVAQKTVPMIDHTNVTIPAVAPTCDKEGLTEGVKCSVCSTVLTAQQTIPKLAHTEVIMPAVTPTCSKEGLTEGVKCSVCDTILFPQQTVPTLAHTEVIVPAVAPTCTNTGLTEGVKCSVCNQTVVDQKTVPATGHDYAKKEADASNCLSAASYVFTCSKCGHTKTEQASLVWSDWSTEIPSDVAEQFTESKTQYRYSDRESNWSDVTKAAVTYVKSWPSGFDKTNGLYSKYNNTPKTASESETEKVVIVSEEIVGYLYYHWCENYQYGPLNRLISTEKDGSYSTFHAFYDTSNYGSSDSNGVNGGIAKYCSYPDCCKDSYWYLQIPVYKQTYTTQTMIQTGDNWTDWSAWSDTPYTENEDRRVETRTLNRYVTGGLGAHKYGEGVVITPPTETATGIMSFICTVCGLEITEIIPTTDHVHVFNDWKVTTAATCTADGEESRSCSCGESETRTAVALGHDYQNNVCTRCGERLPELGPSVPEGNGGLLGDVNEDGKVDSRDLVRLRKYFAQVEGTVINETNSDANVDGSISSLDMVRLTKYFAQVDGVVLG